MKFKSALVVASLLVLAVFSAQVMAYVPTSTSFEISTSTKKDAKSEGDQSQEPVSLQINATGVSIQSGFSVPTIWTDLCVFFTDEWNQPLSIGAFVPNQAHLQLHFRKVLFQYIISSQAP
jgi:hypothetical protein